MGLWLCQGKRTHWPHLDSDHAFQVLKRFSQSSNRKLHDVAAELVDTRELPG